MAVHRYIHGKLIHQCKGNADEYNFKYTEDLLENKLYVEKASFFSFNFLDVKYILFYLDRL